VFLLVVTLGGHVWIYVNIWSATCSIVQLGAVSASVSHNSSFSTTFGGGSLAAFDAISGETNSVTILYLSVLCLNLIQILF
jgi:hypothetical protein